MAKENPVRVEQFELGQMENFIYFLGCRETNEIAVVDPAWDAAFISKHAADMNLAISCVLLTHGHFDHTNALDDLLEMHSVPAYVSKHEAPIYRPDHPNIREVADKEKISIGHIEVTCLHTPGHTPGGQCFLTDDLLLTGDTLFVDGCGRCDLPGGDPKKMYHSLYDVLMKLPEHIRIYPGHNYGPVPYDSLANQKKTNRYLTSMGLEEFLHKRMGF